MRKWGEWMVRRDHTGRTDLAYDDDSCKCKGVLNAAEDDGNLIAWDDDNEYGGNRDGSLVHFGLQIAQLEYGEDDELKDESHDLRLFNKEDGGADAKREAERLFGG